MTESQELFPDSELMEDEIINKILREDEEEERNLKVETEKEVEEVEKTSDRLTNFPLARIKNIMKMDPDVSIVSQEAVVLVAKATELFLDSLAKETYKYTLKAKRKAIQKRDLETAIENIDILCFLEGALE